MDEHAKKRLSEIIRELKGKKSLRQLARELKVSAVAVNSWEHGDTDPNLDSLEKIAKVKGWTIYQLLAYMKDETVEEEITFEKVAEKASQLSESDKLKLASLLLTQVQS